jgi:hypothetical protein
LFVVLAKLLADKRVLSSDRPDFRGLCATPYRQLVCAYAATVGLAAHARATPLNNALAFGFDVD